jgi:hypothetical protein
MIFLFLRPEAEHFIASIVFSQNIITITADRIYNGMLCGRIIMQLQVLKYSILMVRRQSGISRSIYFFERPCHCWILVFRCNV